MAGVMIDQNTYEMPPKQDFSVAHFLAVADIERSANFYAKVFDAEVLTLGDGNAPAYLRLANVWLIMNLAGGPTPDKPSVTIFVPDPDYQSSFLNIRVDDIAKCYDRWRSRGAEFLTPPMEKYGEIRCYIRDPDGYIIEIGESKPGFKYG